MKCKAEYSNLEYPIPKERFAANLTIPEKFRPQSPSGICLTIVRDLDFVVLFLHPLFGQQSVLTAEPSQVAVRLQLPSSRHY